MMDERDERDKAARVGAKVDLLDLRLRRIEAELHKPAYEGPFRFTLDVKPSVVRAEKLVAYTLQYAFSSTDNEDELVLNGSVELSVLYATTADSSLTDDELAAFGRVCVLFTAHPYARELLHSLTGRMGLPPLILDLMQSPVDAEVTGA